MLSNILKAHDLSSWQNNFINRIQIHNQNPWFKPIPILSMEFKSHKQSSWFKLMEIYLSKAQFTLAISKVQFSLATSTIQFTLAIFKSHDKNQLRMLLKAEATMQNPATA